MSNITINSVRHLLQINYFADYSVIPVRENKVAYAQVHCPESLTHTDLDKYLSQGWFRMGQNIFTTNFLNFKDIFYSAIWLRIDLKNYVADHQQTKIFKRNAAFKTVIRPAAITADKELLFFRYRQFVPFEPPQSITALLMGKAQHNVFDTYEVCVYDEDRLIAVGFFDVGEESAAGISSIYDPEYKKFSLGKFLIYSKIDFCLSRGMRFFYPGYFVPGYSFFDYKLSMGQHALEFLPVATKEWTSISQYTEQLIPLNTMRTKLSIMQNALTNVQISSTLLLYEYFDANLIPELVGAELLDLPIFLRINDGIDGTIPFIIFFDVRDNKFHLIKCFSVWSPVTSKNRPEYFDEHLLKIEMDLFSTDDPELLINVYNQIKLHHL